MPGTNLTSNLPGTKLNNKQFYSPFFHFLQIQLQICRGQTTIFTFKISQSNFFSKCYNYSFNQHGTFDVGTLWTDTQWIISIDLTIYSASFKRKTFPLLFDIKSTRFLFKIHIFSNFFFHHKHTVANRLFKLTCSQQIHKAKLIPHFLDRFSLIQSKRSARWRTRQHSVKLKLTLLETSLSLII